MTGVSIKWGDLDRDRHVQREEHRRNEEPTICKWRNAWGYEKPGAGVGQRRESPLNPQKDPTLLTSLLRASGIQT